MFWLHLHSPVFHDQIQLEIKYILHSWVKKTSKSGADKNLSGLSAFC